jgi:hypothetical protein
MMDEQTPGTMDMKDCKSEICCPALKRKRALNEKKCSGHIPDNTCLHLDGLFSYFFSGDGEICGRTSHGQCQDAFATTAMSKNLHQTYVRIQEFQFEIHLFQLYLPRIPEFQP